MQFPFADIYQYSYNIHFCGKQWNLHKVTIKTSWRRKNAFRKCIWVGQISIYIFFLEVLMDFLCLRTTGVVMQVHRATLMYAEERVSRKVSGKHKTKNTKTVQSVKPWPWLSRGRRRLKYTTVESGVHRIPRTNRKLKALL